MFFLFRLIRKIGLLDYLILKTRVHLNGKRIVIPVIGGTGMENINITEKWMLELLGKLPLREDSTIVDVGVNLGQTLIKLKSTYPSVDYIGFEPNTVCVNYVESLIRLNNWQKTSVFPVAIAENSGVEELVFYADSSTDSCASIIRDFRDSVQATSASYCLSTTGNDIGALFESKEVSLIKIDVEGAELGVLYGLQNLIARDLPSLIVEILPVYNSENKSRLQRQLDIEILLTHLGYYMYRIVKNDDGDFCGLKEIDSIGVHSNLEWCDYLFSTRKFDKEFTVKI